MVFDSLIYSLYCVTQNCAQHSRRGHAIPEQSRTIASLAWLVMLYLMPLRTGVALLAAGTLLPQIELTRDQDTQIAFYSSAFQHLILQSMHTTRCPVPL